MDSTKWHCENCNRRGEIESASDPWLLIHRAAEAHGAPYDCTDGLAAPIFPSCPHGNDPALCMEMECLYRRIERLLARLDRDIWHRMIGEVLADHYRRKKLESSGGV